MAKRKKQSAAKARADESEGWRVNPFKTADLEELIGKIQEVLTDAESLRRSVGDTDFVVFIDGGKTSEFGLSFTRAWLKEFEYWFKERDSAKGIARAEQYGDRVK